MVEERKEEEKKQNEEYEKKNHISSPDKYLKQYTPQISKVPNMGNIKL